MGDEALKDPGRHGPRATENEEEQELIHDSGRSSSKGSQMRERYSDDHGEGNVPD
jgi:hypothetical protein